MLRILTTIALLAASAAQATTIIMPADEQLVEKSPVIVAGTVVATEPIDRDGTIWTDTTVRVTRTIKGAADGTITVRELGGVANGRITKIFGAPEFTAGENVLLFLEPSPRGGYRVMDLFVGKFSEGQALDGRRLWLRHDRDADATLLDADFRPVRRVDMQRDAAGFETFVTDRVAGREGKKTYGVENPVMVDDAAAGGGIQSNFTLIAEPAVYRWFRFQNGLTAAWYHGGTQPGYPGNGISELQTAMNVWTSYSDAKILYSYNGAINVAIKGLDPRNNVNEVLFGDPLNEIAGTWNPATGGVVGQGGFNGVENGGTFTATFQADPAHPAGPMNAFAIVEANLTIQNGVAPTKGISSTRLAEIVAHEFGHTLGLGHSESTDALMFFQVTGLGPSLREDDRVAARWLYPNGGGGNPTPSVPAAPSNLAAVPGSNSVDLSWTDNATDETSQIIYLAVGGGSFSAVGSVGPNVTSVRLTSLAAGTYRAYVVAANGAGNSPQSNTVTFTLGGAPVAAFTMTPESGSVGVTNFTFTDQSLGTVTSRQWQFGDGGSSTSSMATHTYAASGQYTVTLTVTGPGGSSSTSKTLTVSGPLNPRFEWSPAFPAPNETIQFMDQSGGAPTGWYWTFGDGSTSTAQNPAKQYTSAGTYTVTLLVTRGGASASLGRTVIVANSTPGTQPAVAAFDISPAVPAPGASVSFIDRSSGAPTSWQWSFGDGAASTERNPSHVYATAGTYTVSLTAANAIGSGSLTRQLVVSPVAPYRTLVSAAAQTAGQGGTSWRTELSVFNAGVEGANVTMRFLPTLAEKTLYLAPRQSVTYANTLLDAFGLANGAGAVTIEASSAGSAAQLRVTSRTFTSGETGTYGQSVPEVQSDQLGRTLYVTGIQSNTAFRTNVGLVNRAGAVMPVSMTLHSDTGDVVATKDVTLPASSFQQSALWAHFPEVQGVSHDVLSLKITTSAADAVSAYASVVDNATQDPIYIQAVAEPSESSLIIPAVGRAPGANGTYWRSDLTLFNPASTELTVTLRYGATSRTLTLAGRATRVLADVLSFFNLSAGSGALFVSWNGIAGPVVTSRTYTTSGKGGTFGQSIDPASALSRIMFVPGLRNDGTFRTNIGFVNGGDESETFTVVMLSPSGTELGRKTLNLAAKAQAQHSVSSLFPGLTSGAFTLLMEGDANARLFAYGSMVDNASGDPVFFAGE